MAIKTYEDSFRAVFSENEDLRDFLKQVETEEEWISVDRELAIRKNNPSESKDEIEKSSMFSIYVNGEFRPLGETSIPGLQEAAGNGKTFLKLLSDHSYERYVSNINEGLDIMEKKRKLLYRSGKIRNIVSLNYKPLPQRELVSIFCDEMQKVGQFKSALYTHEKTIVTYKIIRTGYIFNLTSKNSRCRFQ